MKYSFGAAALFAATVSADLCSYGSSDNGGNFYCQKVNAITYTGVGGSGSYNKVTKMDSTTGSCSSTPHGYSGTMAPFDEEVSMHFRGPLKLKQFAFYTPGSASAKKVKARRSAVERRHAHGHNHAHLHKAREAEPEPEPEPEPALGDLVTAIIDGKVATWINQYSGESSSPAAAAPVASTPQSYGGSASAKRPATYSSSASTGASSASSTNKDDDYSSSSGSGWGRQAYYNSEKGIAHSLVFLNHEGGTGSGVFDYSFGNSLSYASADGSSGSPSPQTLADTTLKSDTEVIIMSDKKCSDDEGCGYYRDGTVAYHGFDGPSKAFFFEFEMPDDGQAAASKYVPVNMPAIWMLNAQIPRTLQYGKSECSCWESGCGEFDIFEVLAAGDTRCKSTLHGNKAGGNSDYFARPTNGTMKAAFLLYQDNIHIKVLDDDHTFGAIMDDTFVSEICADTATDSMSKLVSLFKLGS